MSDILTYKPKGEWNNTIINFGMPSIAGNLRLTEICLESQDCLTATKRAMDLSFTEGNWAAARTPPVLEVVRTLFGADTGIEIETSAAIYETHDIETYVEGFGPELVAKDWLIDIDKYIIVGLQKTSDISHNTKFVWTPRDISMTTGHRAHAYGQGVTGANISNWDEDGEPYYVLSFLPFWHQYCSDGVTQNQNDCQNATSDGYCRTAENTTEPVVCKNITGGEVVPYDSTDLIRQTTFQYCLQGQYNASSGGKCYYSNNNGQTWTWYQSGWSKSNCLEYTQTVGGWNHLWWMWEADGNSWYPIYHNWFPSLDTYNHFKEYRVKTSSSKAMEIYPQTHMTHTDFSATTPISMTVYQHDVNDSWGNGEEVYNSQWPTWVTEVYDWPDYDNMYAAPVDIYTCSDQSYHCNLAGVNVPEWIDETNCLAAGTCTNASYDNNQSGCLAEGVCIEDSAYVNNSVACLAHGHTWVDAANVWSGMGYGWGIQYPDQSTCETAGHTWQFSHTEPLGATIIPTKEIEVPVDPNYFIPVYFGIHGFVNHVNARVSGQYGYTGNNGLVESSKIRWYPPQYNIANDKNQLRPTHFRIYRAPYYSPNGLTLTDSDYEAGIWKFAGEVPCVSRNGYHYFYDTRLDMFNEGLDAYQTAQYSITAVWKGYNWKRGFRVQRYDNMNPSAWDIYCNSNALLTTVANTNYDYLYDDMKSIHIDDNTNNRTYRISGYMKAPMTGDYRIWINSDDAMYVWTGTNQQTIASLESNITWYNATVDEPGYHGDRSEYSAYFPLNEGDIIPILAYMGQGGGGMTCRMQIHYPSGTWDNGVYNTGGWEYSPIYMMPEDMDPLTVSDGQDVEGPHSTTSVPSNYRN